MFVQFNNIKKKAIQLLYSSLPFYLLIGITLSGSALFTYATVSVFDEYTTAKSLIKDIAPYAAVHRLDDDAKSILIKKIDGSKDTSIMSALHAFHANEEEKTLLHTLLSLPGFSEYTPFIERYTSLTEVEKNWKIKKIHQQNNIDFAEKKYTLESPINSGKSDIESLLLLLEDSRRLGVLTITHLDISTMQDPYKEEVISCSMEFRHVTQR